MTDLPHGVTEAAFHLERSSFRGTAGLFSCSKLLRLAGLIGLLTLAMQTYAQPRTRSSAYLPFGASESPRYNLKWGSLRGRVDASFQFEATDNLNLADTDPEADFSFAPQVNVGFVWQVSRDQMMHFDTGIGYRFYVNNPSVSSINIAPSSKIRHQLTIGPVNLEVHDGFTIQTDPTSLGAVSGTPGQLLNFRRFNNTVGLNASYEPIRNLTLDAGYDYAIDRSLSSQFTSLDRDVHVLGAGTFYAFTPKFTLGLQANYSMTEFLEKTQNDGSSWSVGPVVSYKPNNFFQVSGSVFYSVSQFDLTGTINDNENIGAVTYSMWLNHTLTRTIDHSLRISRSIGDGLGSNFTDVYAAQYGLRSRMTRKITLQGTLAYEHFLASGIAGEKADRILAYLGTGYQITSKWNMGVAYSYALKASDTVGRDYSQNRLTFDFTRQF